MSNFNSTIKHSYRHLSEAERGQIEAYLAEGLKPAEIARRLGRNRSTISREIKRGSVKQVKWVNGKQVYYKQYFSDAAQNRYIKNREGIYYLKLAKVTENFLSAFTEAMKFKPRVHSIDTFVHFYKIKHPNETVPSTKTMYNYIHQGLMTIKPIDLPKVVRIRRKYKIRPSTKKHLGVSIEQRSKTINDRSTFGHWEIDSLLGLNATGEPSILTLVERQTRFALTAKLPEKKANYVNQAVLNYIEHYPIKSITADNGSEFALLNEIDSIDVYFAHAYSSHERGTNEHFNGLLREYIPKGISINGLNEEDLEAYTQAINNRPRKIHNYQSAQKLFEIARTVKERLID